MTMRRSVPGLLSLLAAVALAGCGSYEGGSGGEAAAASPAEDVRSSEPAAQFASRSVEQEQPEAEAEPAETEATKTPPERTPRRPRELQAAESPNRPATALSPSTLRIEPASLDLGRSPTNEHATGTVKLTNVGDEPLTVTQCKTSCGCTSTNCPKGEELAPGESAEVNVRVTTGTRSRTINKTVTFIVENQKPVTMPVKVEVVAYVEVEPTTIVAPPVPEEGAEQPQGADSMGRIVVRSTDGEPFRIVSMSPRIIEDFGEEPKTEHEVLINWEKWRSRGERRRLVFTLDHPQTRQAVVIVRIPPRARTTRRSNELISAAPRADTPRASATPALPSRPGSELTIAARYGDLERINKAIQDGVSDAALGQLLNVASRFGRANVMAALLEAGADIKSANDRGRTPLMSAIQSRNVEAVKLLLDRGADVNARDSFNGTPLARAAGPFGNKPMVEQLLEAGADVNVVDNRGMTPLMWAVRFGDADRVRVLLDAGADPAVRDRQGMSALDYARSRRDDSADTIVGILEPGEAESSSPQGEGEGDG